jgi:hypothetical protein
MIRHKSESEIPFCSFLGSSPIISLIVPHAEVLGSPRSSSAHGREGRHRCSFGDRPDVWNLDGGESSEVLYLVPILSIQSAQQGLAPVTSGSKLVIYVCLWPPRRRM